MKVLVIDDSTLSRNLLKRALGDDFQCIEAENGMRGLELYFIEKPDLVILDLNMPNMNGLEVLQQLLQLDPAARVIIGSADVQIFTRDQAVQYGAMAYINKPFTAEEVRQVVSGVMSSSGTGEGKEGNQI